MKKAKSIPDPGPLRLLIVEDSPADAELIQRELRRAGISFTSQLVDGKREFNKSLADFQPQVILSDFKMPGFDGLAALKIARLRSPDIPFIFVSGSIGEDKAIETLTLGAADYILKDNLARLGPAIRRVVAETQLKLEKEKNEEELRLLAEAADRFVHINDLDKIYDYLAGTICDISGADYLLLSLYDDKLQALRPKIATGFEPFRERMRRRFHSDPMELIFFLKDMRPDDFNDFISRRLLPVRDGLYGLANRKMPRSLSRLMEKFMGIVGMYTMGFSWENQLFGGLTVFFKKENKLKNASQIEALVNLAAVAIKRLSAEKSLGESEQKYRALVTQSPDGIFIVDLQGNFLSINQAMCEGLGYTEAELLAMKIWDIVPEQYMDLHKERLGDILKGTAKNEAAEYMVKGKDGESHYVAILSAPYFKDDKLIGFQGIARDITESKKMEIRLRESEEYYRILVDTSPDAIIIVDGGGRVTFASQKAFEVFAVPAQISLAGFQILNFVDPDEVPRVQGRMVEILSGRSLPEIREYRLLRHDRRPFWGEISSAPLQDAAGRNIGLLLVCRNISERKMGEEEILREKTFLEKLVETAPEGIVIADKQGRVLKVNREFERMFGYGADEAIGKLIDDLVVSPGYREEANMLNKSVGAGEKAILESVRSRKDGTLLHVSIIIAPIYIKERQVAVYAIYQDISERKHAEMIQQIQYKIANAMATAKTLFSFFETVRNELSAALDTTNFLFAIYDAATGMLSAPFEKDEKDAIPQWPAEKSLTGLVIKQKRSMLLRGEELRQLDQAGRTELIGSQAEAWLGVPLLINEKVLGAIVVQSYDNANAYGQNSIMIMEIIANQLSIYIERKQVEAEILREKAFLEALVETAPQGIAITDCSGRVQRVNPEFVRMFGYKADEAVGKSINDLVAPREYLDEAYAITRSTGAGETSFKETMRKRKDGTLLYVSIIGVPIFIAEQQVAVYAIYSDISGRKLAEEQIRNSLKEKEVLLQEIHHRVKNNLQIISGLLTLQADQAAGKSLDEIFRESQDRIRSIALIHEKLYRSHNLAEIAFDEYLRALTENLFTSHGVAAGRITAKYEMESIFFTIEKAIPLGLIVNELVSNSLKHAFPAGKQGEIRIGLHGHVKTKSPALKTDSGRLQVTHAFELTVADNGVGLPAGFNTDTQKTLGMHLVAMLSRQLQAELKVGSGPETEFKLIFSGLAPQKGAQ